MRGAQPASDEVRAQPGSLIVQDPSPSQGKHEADQIGKREQERDCLL